MQSKNLSYNNQSKLRLEPPFWMDVRNINVSIIIYYY